MISDSTIDEVRRLSEMREDVRQRDAASTFYVLQLNDYPIGVYKTEESAGRAGEKHEAEFFRWKNAHTARYYRVYPFQLDGDAKL